MTADPAEAGQTRHPHRAVLALGSNLGDSAHLLDEAIGGLARLETVEVTGTSPRAVTAPVGGPAGQPDFLNQIITVATSLSPLQLLRAGQQLEAEAQRVRTVRWGPRTLDVDVISYWGAASADPSAVQNTDHLELRLNTEELVLPHPRAHQRAFVLAPWAWLDPAATLNGELVADLARTADDLDDIHRVQDN